MCPLRHFVGRGSLVSLGMLAIACGARPSPAAHPAAAHFSKLRDDGATVYVVQDGECTDWRFEGEHLVHVAPRDRVRYLWNLSQSGDVVRLDDPTAESLEPGGSSGSGGPAIDFRILGYERSFIELRIVDHDDFDVSATPLEPCRWYVTRQACEGAPRRNSCRM